MDNNRAFLETACPTCEGRFEFPADYYEDNQQCPHCGRLVKLIQRPLLTPREYAVLCNGALREPLSFKQVLELWRSGSITAENEFRILPNGKWEKIRKLHIDASDSELMNQLPILIKRPIQSYPEGPFSGFEVQEMIRFGRIPQSTLFWTPYVSHWVEPDVFAMMFDPEAGSTLADRLENSIRNWQQTEPPSLHNTQSSLGVAGDAFLTWCGKMAGATVLLLLVLLLVNSCN